MLKSLAVSLSLAFAALAAPASGSPPAQSEVAEVTILPGWRTESGTHMAALRIRLAPGWKTYWRAPGDAGIPPRFDWAGSRNIRGVAFHWPVPMVLEQNGMRTIGYTDELVLPMEFTPARRGEPLVLRAKVELGVCHDICMPMQVNVAADLPAEGERDLRIRAAIANLPFSGTEVGAGPVSCRIEPIRDGMRVTAAVPVPALGPGEVAVIEHPDQEVWVAEATARRSGDVLTVVTDMVAPSGKPFSIDRSKLLFTVLGGGRGVELRGCSG